MYGEIQIEQQREVDSGWGRVFREVREREEEGEGKGEGRRGGRGNIGGNPLNGPPLIVAKFMKRTGKCGQQLLTFFFPCMRVSLRRPYMFIYI